MKILIVTRESVTGWKGQGIQETRPIKTSNLKQWARDCSGLCCFCTPRVIWFEWLPNPQVQKAVTSKRPAFLGLDSPEFSWLIVSLLLRSARLLVVWFWRQPLPSTMKTVREILMVKSATILSTQGPDLVCYFLPEATTVVMSQVHKNGQLSYTECVCSH